MSDVTKRVGIKPAVREELARLDSDYSSKMIYLGVPELDDVDQIVVSADMKVGAYTVAASPDVPRVLTVVHTQIGGVTDTLGTITFVGTDYDDQALTEVITPVTEATATGLKAFKTVTTATGAGWVVNSTADTITIGTGPALGLPEKMAVSVTNSLALLATVPEVISAIGTMADVPNSTITLTSALNGGTVYVLGYF